MDTRNWQLKLDVEKRENTEIYEHVFYPAYLNCYEDAVRNIFFRILRNEKEQEAVKGKYSYASRRDIINILSFMGERGSGKTTAMREFCQILQNMNGDVERNWWLNRAMPDEELLNEISRKKTYFKVLEPIDASSLEAKEDLFELVLATIFKEYDSSVNGMLGVSAGRTNMEIIEKFEKIVEGYHAIKNVRNEDFGDSYISRLKYMSSSIDIKKEIDELVEHLLIQWRGEKDSSLLVISIDDLDLNLANGYEMLEQLHKYFANHNIVILLAVDYKQMGLVCKMHYVNQFMNKKYSSDERMDEYSHKLAKDYMLKVMPLDARVYMPDMKYKEFFVVAEERNGKTIGDTTDIKKFVMRKVAERMGVFYDILGVKRHFVTPETVRELVDYNQFLDSLNQSNYTWWQDSNLTVEEKKRRVLEYNSNYERFIGDIRTRIAKKFLSNSQLEFLDEILATDLERRAAVFCEKTWEETDNREMRQKYEGSRDSNDRYEYGDLIRAIHDMGRRVEQNKELIKCILAIFNAEMIWEKVNFLYNPNSDERARAYKRLKGFLGKSFNNKWLQGFLARMKMVEYRGFSDVIEMSALRVRFAVDLDEALTECDKNTNITKELLTGFLENITNVKLVPTLEILLMPMVIYTSDKYKGEKTIELEIEYDITKSESDKEKELIVKCKNQTGKLDIMGFVEKTLGYEEKCKIIQEVIGKALSGMMEKYLQTKREKGLSEEEETLIRTEISRCVQETSVHTQIKWEKHDAAAFPFYDFDMSYNIMKRLRRIMEREAPFEVVTEECYAYIRKYYEELGNLLQLECAEYENCSYYENYIKCPYIEAFIHAEKYLNPDFPLMFGRTLVNILSPRILRPIDEVGEF